MVTEEWFSVSSGFQYLVTAQRQPLFSMLSGLDTAGKDLPALAELQQANDNLKAHCDLWLESPLQTHVGHVPVLRRHLGKVTCASVLLRFCGK